MEDKGEIMNSHITKTGIDHSLMPAKSKSSQCETCRFGGHKEKGCMSSTCTPRYAPQEGCPMYAMSAQAFMQRVGNAQRRIVNMERLAADYRDMAMRVTGELKTVYVKGSVTKDRLGENMDVFMDICEEIRKQADRLREYIVEAGEVIGRLCDGQEQEVLELRYLSGLTWQDISKKMGINERTLRRIHVRALEHVQREMDVLEYKKHRPGWNPGGAAAAQYIQ